MVVSKKQLACMAREAEGLPGHATSVITAGHGGIVVSSAEVPSAWFSVNVHGNVRERSERLDAIRARELRERVVRGAA